ncbi:hypothetical protein BS78_02G379400 [Paspalum vaginatum]|nr:hypothetical protein BS78_02G379400 [Paspalum vaginatum]
MDAAGSGGGASCSCRPACSPRPSSSRCSDVCRGPEGDAGRGYAVSFPRPPGRPVWADLADVQGLCGARRRRALRGDPAQLPILSRASKYLAGKRVWNEPIQVGELYIIALCFSFIFY